MLPVRLSNNLCSLKPRVDRLTVSCIIDLTDDGQVKNYVSAARSFARRPKLSYDEVSDYFYKGNANRTVKPFLELLDDIARCLADAARAAVPKRRSRLDRRRVQGLSSMRKGTPSASSCASRIMPTS